MVLDDSQWSHKAWMSVTDADLFEQILLRKAATATKLNVLEWGSGRSTHYYTGLLQRQGIDFFWNSLEYDREYFVTDIQALFANTAQSFTQTNESGRIVFSSSNVCINVFDYGKLSPFLAEHAEDRKVPMDEYVALPSSFGQKFDLVLVDGRKRRLCTLEAKELLKPGGVVIVHDAYRPYYHCAFEAFPSHRFVGDILWIGSNSEVDLESVLV